MEDEVLCRMRLGPLVVDFMSPNPEVLGLADRWSGLALGSAADYPLADDLHIRLVAPALCVATKLEA